MGLGRFAVGDLQEVAVHEERRTALVRTSLDPVIGLFDVAGRLVLDLDELGL